LEIFSKPKQGRKGEKVIKELGPHPKTKKPIMIFESKSGRYLRRGFKRIMLPNDVDVEKMTIEEALVYMKSS